ncbi:MAG: hypothetical protein ACJAZ0_002740 [Halioglobus sp.]|jgi:hypothetical protein
MILHVKRSLLLVILLMTSISVNAFQSFETVGEGSMRWLFFQLYEAKLLSPDGVYEQSKWPLALELTYQREIAKVDLVEATKVEWQRMEVDYVAGWLEALVDFWPDVVKGDVLVFHVDESAVGRFYYNGELIGKQQDEIFSSAFLSIWLSEQSRNQSLKNRLVGADK